MLPTIVIHVARPPAEPPAMLRARHRPGVAVIVANRFRPTILNTGAPAPCGHGVLLLSEPTANRQPVDAELFGYLRFGHTVLVHGDGGVLRRLHRLI